MLTLNYLTNQ